MGWGRGNDYVRPLRFFHSSVGMSADPGPVESWQNVQTSGLSNCVSRRGVPGIYSDGVLAKGSSHPDSAELYAWFPFGLL